MAAQVSATAAGAGVEGELEAVDEGEGGEGEGGELHFDGGTWWLLSGREEAVGLLF